MRSLNSNQVIVSILLFLIFLFSLLLYLDFRKRIGIGDKEVIGIIRYKEKLIQRKLDGQVVWETVDRDTPVTNRDSIRTADNSSVSIELNDKTEITMDENSMILLDFSNKSINLDFVYGAFSAKRSEADKAGDSKLNIKSEDKTIEIKNSDVKLTKTDEKNLNLTVDKGDATIKTKEGEKVIEKDQLATVKEEKVEVNSKPVKLLKPLDKSTFLSSGSLMAINFQWEPQESNLPKADSALLEIAEDYKFTKKSKKIPVKQDLGLELQLPSSTYYWRVVTKNKAINKEEVSEVRKVSIINEEPIRLYSPAHKAKYAYTNSLPVINFSWNTSEYSSSYKLEIAKDNEFKEIVKSIDSFTSRIALDSLVDGLYFARVSSKFNSSNALSRVSEVVMFSVEKKIELDLVEITTPDTASATITALEKEKFFLNWKGSPQYNSYEIQISEDKGFQTILQNQKISKNFLIPDKNLKKKLYYWRVRGITKDNRNSEFSSSKFEIREPINLDFISPKDNSEFAVKSTDKIDFKWNKTDIYGTYKLEISSDIDFKSIIKSESTTSFGISLSGFNPGNYFVRLTLINLESGEEILKCKPRTFKIPILVNEPVLIYPIKSEVVDMSDLDLLKLSWDTVVNAISYKLEIYQKTDNGDKLILSEDLNRNEFTIKELDLLDEGKFKWVVRAKIRSNEGKEFMTPSAVEYFSISLKASPSSAPEIVSPRKQHTDKKF